MHFYKSTGSLRRNDKIDGPGREIGEIKRPDVKNK